MIVILTGAGISRESGLATFRDSDGLWAQERIEDVATPGGFKRDPLRVYNFYNLRRQELKNVEVKPNAAHLALAHLEAKWPEPVWIITQNVDDLHERAGSKNLIHLHGEHLKARCQSCRAVSPWADDLGPQDACPQCLEVGVLRPHIVWFEEMPLCLDEVYHLLGQAEIFVSIGTSGDVMPAAAFVQEAKLSGAQTVELNLENSRYASVFDQAYYGPATEVVPQWVDELLKA